MPIQGGQEKLPLPSKSLENKKREVKDIRKDSRELFYTPTKLRKSCKIQVSNFKKFLEMKATHTAQTHSVSIHLNQNDLSVM